MADETQRERLNRNWEELLQELRVSQTGVQILTGFLLTVPFSQRFSDLSDLQVAAYLTALCGGVLSTGFLIAPVAFHRVLFRKREKAWLVTAANLCARAGLVLLALTVSSVVFLVFDLVIGLSAAVASTAIALAFFTTLWAVVPMSAPKVEEE
ncbi:sodium:proton antiporter [Nocardioides guangzhouensis]|uniref:Sodium:proton antiporter n=1 Tax=Nocardioides guangzhouensis TaxID=2497878 RepID=A0A4Q4Z795_9ACTN|nr:DUF6328 family protein [Nocardioides guangzhouensis]RYP83717.1 sodium:proton antiporter [Nocardioides guangzhouensis]